MLHHRGQAGGVEGRRSCRGTPRCGSRTPPRRRGARRRRRRPGPRRGARGPRRRRTRPGRRRRCARFGGGHVRRLRGAASEDGSDAFTPRRGLVATVVVLALAVGCSSSEQRRRRLGRAAAATPPAGPSATATTRPPATRGIDVTHYDLATPHVAAGRRDPRDRDALDHRDGAAAVLPPRLPRPDDRRHDASTASAARSRARVPSSSCRPAQLHPTRPAVHGPRPVPRHPAHGRRPVRPEPRGPARMEPRAATATSGW